MIEVKELTKRYSSHPVVHQLSFVVRPGVVTGFLGPNGAGKSTTMRVIIGLDRPDVGSVTIDGKPYVELIRPLQKVGALLDAGWARPKSSARNHLRWVASLNELPLERVDELLELVGLAQVGRKRVGEFSLGMRQRLGIATALLGDPEVLLFDEPMNGLDPEGIHWIRRLLKEFAADGRTVLISSHLLSEMALTADEIVVFGAGRLVSQGPTREFIEQATQSKLTVRTPDMQKLTEILIQAGVAHTASNSALSIIGESAERVGELAANHGIVLHELRTDHGSLEEAFMKLTSESVEYRALAPIERQRDAQ